MPELYNVDNYKKFLKIALEARRNCEQDENVFNYLHPISVAAELITTFPFINISQEEADKAIACALLHSAIENTNYPYEHMGFDKDVVNGVSALKRDYTLPTTRLQTKDCLIRISKLPKYIQMVMMAEQISILDFPPSSKSKEDILFCQNESREILERLKLSNKLLAEKLSDKINSYSKYIDYYPASVS
jgi:(p)ppGpp synthase/HD superfamily hydrolase